VTATSNTSILTPEEKLRVRDAIHAAEARTSGEIRVVVVRRTHKDPMRTARAWFKRLGMERTKEKNGVLICLGAESRTFAILGDEGIHRHLGQAGWDAERDEMAAHFGKGDFAGGLIHAVEAVGAVLAEHFPPRPDDVNELPDEVIET